MQLFSADARIYFLNFKLFLSKTWINCPQKLLIIGPNFIFQYCQPAQNQPKFHFLFHKNGSLCNFYISNDFDIRNCIINYMFWIYFQKIENKSCHQETSAGCNCATVIRICNIFSFNFGNCAWNRKQIDMLRRNFVNYCNSIWNTGINFHDINHKVFFCLFIHPWFVIISCFFYWQ